MGLLKRTGGAGFFVEDSGFFGALVSELDDDTGALTGAFRELAARAGQLRGAYSAGRIDAQVYGSSMADLRVVSSDGREWTIGTTTGRWYVRDGQRPEGSIGGWQVGAPPAETGVLVDAAGVEIGWATEDGGSLAPNAVFTAYTGGDVAVKPVAPTSGQREPASIDSLFDTYVEEAVASDDVTGILAVDELPGDDDWKRRYFELRPVAQGKPKRESRRLGASKAGAVDNTDEQSAHEPDADVEQDPTTGS